MNTRWRCGGCPVDRCLHRCHMPNGAIRWHACVDIRTRQIQSLPAERDRLGRAARHRHTWAAHNLHTPAGTPIVPSVLVQWTCSPTLRLLHMAYIRCRTTPSGDQRRSSHSFVAVPPARQAQSQAGRIATLHTPGTRHPPLQPMMILFTATQVYT